MENFIQVLSALAVVQQESHRKIQRSENDCMIPSEMNECGKRPTAIQLVPKPLKQFVFVLTLFKAL